MLSAHKWYRRSLSITKYWVCGYDTAEDGPEIQLIRFFKWSPRGTKCGITHKGGIVNKLSPWWFQARW